MTTTVAKATHTQTKPWVQFFQLYGPYLAFGQALIAMSGSLYFSEVAGYLPCTLCWYQRVLMYPLVLITIVGIIKQDEFLPNYVLPFSLLGMAVSFYHYLLQLGFVGSDVGCGTLACDSRYINYAGFITIPLLALVAFAIINIVMGATYWAYRQEEAE